MQTAVNDNLDLSLDEMKLYLKEDDDENDTLICLLIESGKEQADSYCNNDFETTFIDGDGDEIENKNIVNIPSEIKLGVMEYVAFLYRNRGSKYEAESMAHEIWKSYRLSPGL